MEMREKLYLAGPMRGLPHFNFPAFNRAAARLRAQGYYVFNPAEADINRGEEVALNADGDMQRALDAGFNLRDALMEDVTFIIREADAIALLPGWHFSSGASAEYYLAKALGLPAYLLDDDGKIILKQTTDAAGRLQWEVRDHAA